MATHDTKVAPVIQDPEKTSAAFNKETTISDETSPTPSVSMEKAKAHMSHLELLSDENDPDRGKSDEEQAAIVRRDWLIC